MWNNPRNIAFLIFAVILAVTGFLAYLWTGSSIKSADKGKVVFGSQVNGAKVPLEYSLSDKPFNNKDILSPIVDVLEEAISGIAPDFKAKSPIGPADPAKPLLAYQYSQPPPPPSTAGDVMVSKEEVFTFAFTQEHLNVFTDINKMMIDFGYLNQEQVYPLKNMEDMIALNNKYSDFLGIYSDLTDKDIELYRKAYGEVLPRMWEEEAKFFKMSQRTSFAPVKIFYKYLAESRRRKASKLLSFLSEAIIPKANALVECFREGVGTPGPGSQRAAPCCDCTINRFPIGCLNLICANLPAIWDPETGICACDI